MTEDRKIRVLCVEDEQDIRENIAEILRDEGFEVFEAENGKRGLDAFLKNEPDIIISDIMMPEMDGYGLLASIRENKSIRNNSIPFIFLSALGQKDDVIKGVNLSANDYLIKPIDFDLMIAKIKEKTSNLIKVQQIHNKNISNIKSQVATILPNELNNYLDIITRTAVILKSEPYGPLPHRKYLDDFERIYMNAVKIRSAINNSLDESVIDYKLNAHEEVFSVIDLFNEFIQGINEKFRARISFDSQTDYESLPNIKVDHLVIFEAIRKIFAGYFRCDHQGSISINMMFDHLNQLVIIFYLKSRFEKADLKKDVDEKLISKILDKQNCRFEIVDGKDNTSVMIIPSYRLIHR